MRQFSLALILLLTLSAGYAQQKFKVVVTETATSAELYSLIDENGKLIRQLDTSKYLVSFNNDQYVYFAVFGRKDFKGWAAIDAKENILFNVYNTSFGEPSPDYLLENKIRIVDSNDLIGFANNKGQIIISPQFEIASAFNKGKAIIGQSCKKIPWNKHATESDCQHFSIVCNQHGYINSKGTILKIGDYSFEAIQKEINWKSSEDD